MQICRGFTTAQWKGLSKRLLQDEAIRRDGADWRCAVDVFERRIRERFLSCIEALQEADSKLDVEVSDEAPANCSTLPEDDGAAVVVPGFSIMALCCLLVETLQSFRTASHPAATIDTTCTFPDGPCIRPESGTTVAFIIFLQRPSFGNEFVDHAVAKSFVTGVRNGILHEAETRRWAIWRDEPKERMIALLPGSPHRYAVNRTAFYAAVKAEFLSYIDELRNASDEALRRRFVKKMNDIAKEA